MQSSVAASPGAGASFPLLSHRRNGAFAARSVLVRTSVSSGMLLLTWPAPFLSRHSCVSAGATCPRCGVWLSACAVPTLRDAAGPRGQDLPRGPAPLSLIGPGRHLSLLCGGFSLFRVVVFSSIWRGPRVHILSLWTLLPNPQALAPLLLASLLSLLCSCRLGVFFSCEFSCAPEVPCFILAQPVLV